MKKNWEEDDICENHFQDWKSKLEKLKELKTDTLSSNIQEDQNISPDDRIHRILFSFIQ
jgi:hypothetical protein